MIGEYTEKARTYEQIAKHNGVKITKEVRDAISDFITYEEQLKEKKVMSEKQKSFLKMKSEKNEFKEYVRSNLGSFYFNYYKADLGNLEPQYYVRFLYLCSYLDYNNYLIVFKGRNVPIEEKQLPDILKLSKRETVYTKRSLIENKLIEIDKNGYIHINEKYCKRGGIVSRKKVEFTRIFNNAIFELYQKATAKEHKKLALLFELLPYVNLKYNMVCRNPDEEMVEKIEPYTVKELANMLNQKNITRFKNDLLDLTVDGESVVVIHTIKRKSILAINPKVYYKGVNLEGLKYLEDLFSVL